MANDPDLASDVLSPYGKLGKGERALEELADLAIFGRLQNEEQLRSWFRKLRKRAGDDWPKYERRIVDGLAGDQRRLRGFYAEMANLETGGEDLTCRWFRGGRAACWA